MKKNRKYSTRRISSKVSYTIHEIAELFSLHKNSVSTWIKSGLPIIDNKKPYLINGADLIQFLNIRQKKRKHICKSYELYCCKCRLPRKPHPNSVIIENRNMYRLKISARCEICQTKMFKDANVQKRIEIEKAFAALLQTQEHIYDCNVVSINSDIRGIEQYEQL